MNTDGGVIYVVIEHFARHLYPRALDMQRRLDAGERLSDADLDHVSQLIEDAKLLRPLIDRHPEHQELAASVVSLYANIARRAWQNETAGAKESGVEPWTSKLA